MTRKTAKPNPYAAWQRYPEPAAHRGGCKVSWNYYRTREEAERCAKIAYANSLIAEREGFDFGYCAPGSIRQMEPGATIGQSYFKDPIVDVGGMFEVCLP